MNRSYVCTGALLYGWGSKLPPQNHKFLLHFWIFLGEILHFFGFLILKDLKMPVCLIIELNSFGLKGGCTSFEVEHISYIKSTLKQQPIFGRPNMG